jgi:hypothetical protein
MSLSWILFLILPKNTVYMDLFNESTGSSDLALSDIG